MQRGNVKTERSKKGFRGIINNIKTFLSSKFKKSISTIFKVDKLRIEINIIVQILAEKGQKYWQMSNKANIYWKCILQWLFCLTGICMYIRMYIYICKGHINNYILFLIHVNIKTWVFTLNQNTSTVQQTKGHQVFCFSCLFFVLPQKRTWSQGLPHNTKSYILILCSSTFVTGNMYFSFVG